MTDVLFRFYGRVAGACENEIGTRFEEPGHVVGSGMAGILVPKGSDCRARIDSKQVPDPSRDTIAIGGVS